MDSEKEIIRAIRSMAIESLPPEQFNNLIEATNWLIRVRSKLKGLSLWDIDSQYGILKEKTNDRIK